MKEFVVPEIEVCNFETADVITTSAVTFKWNTERDEQE